MAKYYSVTFSTGVKRVAKFIYWNVCNYPHMLEPEKIETALDYEKINCKTLHKDKPHITHPPGANLNEAESLF